MSKIYYPTKAGSMRRLKRRLLLGAAAIISLAYVIPTVIDIADPDPDSIPGKILEFSNTYVTNPIENIWDEFNGRKNIDSEISDENVVNSRKDISEISTETYTYQPLTSVLEIAGANDQNHDYTSYSIGRYMKDLTEYLPEEDDKVIYDTAIMLVPNNYKKNYDKFYQLKKKADEEYAAAVKNFREARDLRVDKQYKCAKILDKIDEAMESGVKVEKRKRSKRAEHYHDELIYNDIKDYIEDMKEQLKKYQEKLDKYKKMEKAARIEKEKKGNNREEADKDFDQAEKSLNEMVNISVEAAIAYRYNLDNLETESRPNITTNNSGNNNGETTPQNT